MKEDVTIELIMYLFVLTLRKETLMASFRQGRSTTTSFTHRNASFSVKGQSFDRIAQFRLLRTLRALGTVCTEGNILPNRLYRQMYPNHLDKYGYLKTDSLSPSNVSLTAYRDRTQSVDIPSALMRSANFEASTHCT